MNKKVKKSLPLVIGILIFVVILLFRPIERVKFSDGSMAPGFNQDKTAIVDGIIYKFTGIKKGDVVSHYAVNNSDIFTTVSRIIAIPGETIMIKDGNVYVNNAQLKEAYVNGSTQIIDPDVISEGKNYTLKEDEYFVLDDNRENSSMDSRSIGFINSRAQLSNKNNFINGKIISF